MLFSPMPDSTSSYKSDTEKGRSWLSISYNTYVDSVVSAIVVYVDHTSYYTEGKKTEIIFSDMKLSSLFM